MHKSTLLISFLTLLRFTYILACIVTIVWQLALKPDCMGLIPPHVGALRMGGAIGGARGAMAPPIIWLGGHTVFGPPNILHWNLKF